MITIPNFIQDAITGGVKVTIERDAEYGIRFDMNLMAKSHMYIVYKQDKASWWALMRYDEEHQISDVEELKWAARHGMHGRDYISSDWAEYLMTDEQRAEREFARNALSKLTPEEQLAVKGYFK
jgi:hypothetical protein